VLRTVTALILTLLTLSACGDDKQATQLHGSPVDPPFVVSSQQLVETDGAAYSLTADTDKRLTMVFFGYTNCPDICPVHLANIAAVLGKLPDEVRRDVTVLFITTDPARDSLPRLRQWVRQFDRRFVGLTGSDSLLGEAQRALGVQPAFGSDSSDAGYLVQHAGQVIAFDRDGLARVQYPFGTRQRDWARDLPRLVAADE
jgi:protein SCO1/2